MENVHAIFGNNHEFQIKLIMQVINACASNPLIGMFFMSIANIHHDIDINGFNLVVDIFCYSNFPTRAPWSSDWGS